MVAERMVAKIAGPDTRELVESMCLPALDLGPADLDLIEKRLAENGGGLSALVADEAAWCTLFATTEAVRSERRAPAAGTPTVALQFDSTADHERYALAAVACAEHAVYEGQWCVKVFETIARAVMEEVA